MNCRLCGGTHLTQVLDLGTSPPSNAFLTKSDLQKGETFFPLRLMVCSECHLAQLGVFESRDNLFSPDYVYFSSYSASWVEHAKNYASAMIERLNLNSENFVVEIASNDGYLLKNFVSRKIPCLGIEPTLSTATAALQAGVPTEICFFGEQSATAILSKFRPADLMIANNVLAHVPDLSDFLKGFKTLLARDGVITFEFPELANLLQSNQFDTIYHEHFSYLSLHSTQKALRMNGLRVFDVEKISTHGGSLRVYACHELSTHKESSSVQAQIDFEISLGLNTMDCYQHMQKKADKVRDDFVEFLTTQKKKGLKVIGIGAAAKGNTLFNFCKVRTDWIESVCDSSPHKQGLYLPGTRIPVTSFETLRNSKPDFVVILPWNLKSELIMLLDSMEIKTKIVTVIPELAIESMMA